MVRNLLSATASGLVTFGFLLLWDAFDFMDPIQAYFVAGIVAAAGALIWPAIMGWLLVRRHRNKQNEEIQKEVDRQVSEKTQ